MSTIGQSTVDPRCRSSWTHVVKSVRRKDVVPLRPIKLYERSLKVEAIMKMTHVLFRSQQRSGTFGTLATVKLVTT